ncbi:MAG: ABC transporter substrate-binding protein [Clostridiaceae bacterium]|nr:ABC transporter substrate-binding protein [Clostridiaceae bacterium]
MRSYVLLLVTIMFLMPGLAALSACRQNPRNLTEITFALDWTPNTNHSGLFLARDLGYFAEEGLNVSLQQSDMTFIEQVGSGAAQFGIASQEQVLQARAASGKVPVVAVAAVIQHNTSGFASPVDRKIVVPKDFMGKTYSGWGTPLEEAFIRTLVEADGGDYSKVKIINQSATDFFAALETEADFVWIYKGWDGVAAEVNNYPLNFILLQEIDPQLDFYSPVIIANESVVREQPELVRRFLRAATRGYMKAIEEPAAAVQALLAEAPELDAELLEKSQNYLNTQYIADALRWGEMTKQRWDDFAVWMDDRGLLESKIAVDDAWTAEFLPEWKADGQK